ncbi:hypothetical protein ElyMa_000040000 [Elysia marginata]|uniref:Uncharacterized protein n=1 Tax=Elysia marginata TaxID=1093978 RepID=A0AAV4EDJ2_9GAST|nr:hypothetical protein ElyMa_000040000 [Elysia marginata]
MKTDDVHHKGCNSFDRDTRACINQTGGTDCKPEDSTTSLHRDRLVYRITYTLTAQVDAIETNVYLFGMAKLISTTPS